MKHDLTSFSVFKKGLNLAKALRRHYKVFAAINLKFPFILKTVHANNSPMTLGSNVRSVIWFNLFIYGKHYFTKARFN